MKNMLYYEIKGLPVVIIDNFYDELAEEKIMQELLFLNNDPRKLKDGEHTGTAKDNVGNILKNNKGLFLSDIYISEEYSNILMESNKKLFHESFHQNLEEKHSFFSYFSFMDKYETLISYYEKNDYYKQHSDKCIITAISWFYKTPKSFLGGDLIIENELKIECRKNRMLIFPSILKHEVTKIDMNMNTQLNNNGRFSITHFFHLGYQ